MYVSKKKLVWIAVGILALHLLIAGAQGAFHFLNALTGHPPNNYFEVLEKNGYSEVGVIEDLAGSTDDRGEWKGSSTQTRIILAKKDGKTHLVHLWRDDTGDWKLNEDSQALEGEFEGLERLYFFTYHVWGVLGCPPFRRCDWFYYGSNGVRSIEIPEEALPRDSTIQIYQLNDQEYVLHFVTYLKSEDYWDGGFIEVYRALKGNGFVE